MANLNPMVWDRAAEAQNQPLENMFHLARKWHKFKNKQLAKNQNKDHTTKFLLLDCHKNLDHSMEFWVSFHDL